MQRLIKHLLFAVGYGVMFTIVVLVGGYVYYLETQPDLRVWHQADLDAEFVAERAGEITDLDAYRRLEDQLFAQLQQDVYARIDDSSRRRVNRYHAGSLMDPGSYARNWNRTFELSHDNPVAGAVMIHGLSDSPYSMRPLAQILHKHGLWVVGLRVPGHGTAPSGLLDVTWQDFAAAVRIAASHLRSRIGPNRPFYFVGYSNGAALAVNYSLAALEEEDLPRADALVLLSPAIGVSPMAALAIWQARFSWLTGLDKLAWNSIQPEFDPYKYNSFPVNAGDQIYRLTLKIAERMDRLAEEEVVKNFPKVIAFQSVVDATIPPSTLIDALFARLAPGGHELVLFDVNRYTESESLLRSDPEKLTQRLLGEKVLPFDITLVTNAHPESEEVVARSKPSGARATTDEKLTWSWPDSVFSLSHVAVPFPPDDPVYGAMFDIDKGKNRITLGSVVIRGERDLLQIPDNFFFRLRNNPFFPYLAQRTLEFLGLE